MIQAHNADMSLREADTIYVNTDYCGLNMFLTNDVRVFYGGQKLPPLLAFVSCVFKSDLPEYGGIVVSYGYQKYLLSRCPMNHISDRDLKIPPTIESRPPIHITTQDGWSDSEYIPINDTYRLDSTHQETIVVSKWFRRRIDTFTGKTVLVVGTDSDKKDVITKYIVKICYRLNRDDTTLLPSRLIFEFPTPMITKR